MSANLKKEQKQYRDLNKKLMVLKGLIQDELAPFSIKDSTAETLIEAINTLQNFNLTCIQSLESMIDDLENE